MSRLSSDDQLKFLLSCVKYSSNGKIDFAEVAKEIGVVSRGAASKRYERLLRNNGISLNGGPIKTRTENKAKKRTAGSIVKAAESKRRKIEGDHADPAADDEEDVKPMIPKIEPATGTMMKQEPASGYFGHTYPPPYLPYPSSSTRGFGLPSATNPEGEYIANATEITSWNSSQTPWLSLTDTGTSKMRMSSFTAPDHDRAPSSVLAPAAPIHSSTADAEKEVIAQRQSIVLPAVDSPHNQATTEQIQGEDTVFRDFCISNLFMPPLQRICTPPASPPSQLKFVNSGAIFDARSPAAVQKLSPSTSYRSIVPSGAVQCIIIED